MLRRERSRYETQNFLIEDNIYNVRSMEDIDKFYQKVRKLETIFEFNGGIRMNSRVSWVNVGMIAKGRHASTIDEVYNLYKMGTANSLRAGNYNNFTIPHEAQLLAKVRDMNNNDLRRLLNELERLTALITHHDYAYNVVWYTYYKEVGA